MKLQGRKQNMDNDIAKHWEEVEKNKMKEYDEKMRTKLEEEYKRKMDNAEAISQQLEDFKLNYIKQLKEEMLEGELIKRQVNEDLEREKLKELARQKRIAEMKQSLVESNKEITRQRESDKKRELAEEIKIGEHAKKRLEMENMKKEREE